MIAENVRRQTNYPLFRGAAADSLRSLSANLNPYRSKAAADIETDYRTWLTTLFPTHVNGGFAARHDEFWNWVWALERGVRAKPFVAIWPRGGGKSVSAELAAVMCGAMDKRRFVLYVRSNQDKADESVTNIAGLLESSGIDLYYPKLGQRRLGKFGNSKGWRRQSLRTMSGLVIEGIGLDVASRGTRDLSQRPDLLIFDDVDDRHDSEDVSKRKKEILTQSILPAGSVDMTVLGIQNIIIPHGIFAQLAKPDCDFLINRTVSGPYPAVQDLEYRQTENGYVITAGTPTWQGQSIEICQAQINDWGLQAFTRESQHEVEDNTEGMFAGITFRHCSLSEVPDLVRVACWVDPAVTADGDCQGIQIDGIAADGDRKNATIYRLYSWEGNEGPSDCIRRAIRKAVEYKAEHVGFETNQGGDLWKDTYGMIAKQMLDAGEIAYVPKFREEKADASTGSKAHRASPLLTDYEQGRVVNVFGTHLVLEKALQRFPVKKPFDLVDAGVWGRFELRRSRGGMA